MSRLTLGATMGKMMAGAMQDSRVRAIADAAMVDLNEDIVIPPGEKMREWIRWIAAARSDADALRRHKIVKEHMEPIARVQHQMWAARWAYARPKAAQAEAGAS